MSFISLVPALYINVLQYGADATGTNDSTSAIQAAISAASTTPGSAVFFPAGTYLVSSTITYPGYISLLGSGDADNGTVLKVKTGTNLTTPVLASADWNSNNTTCGNPVAIRDIQINGNSANSGTSGSSAHGIVMMNFWSIAERCSINNVTGDGLQFTAHSKNGNHITNSCVEAKLKGIQVRFVGGNGIRVNDNGSTLNSCTDGFMEDCIVTGAGVAGIQIDMAPGWYVAGNHVYGTGTDAIAANKCYSTRLIGNYVDGYGAGSATFVAGVRMNILDGRGSVCIGNTVSFEGGSGSTATGPYQAFVIQGAGSATSICTVSGNMVNGGNQSGSLGYVVQTSVSQQGHPFIVYFAHNDAQNVATTSFFDQYVTGGDSTTTKHITSIAPVTPTIAAGANAGTTPPTPVKNNCTDVDGQVTFGTGTTPAAGAQVVVTFAQSYGHTPSVTLQANNGATAALNLYTTSVSNTGFTVSCLNTPAASQATTTYAFHYHVLS